MAQLAGRTFWGKAAGVVGVAATASAGIVAAGVGGAHETLQSDGRRFRSAFHDRFARLDLASAATSAAEFGDSRIAPAAEKAKPIAKKVVATVAGAALSGLTQGLIGTHISTDA